MSLEFYSRNNTMMQKRKAFTLAEVLITLGIIGIVAAMTMPTLLANYRKKQTVTQLKKAYSEIQQALKLSEAQNGELSGWNIDDDSQEAKFKFANEYFTKYFKTLKKCAATSEECFPDFKNINGTPVTTTVDKSKVVSFITTSGYSVLFWTHAGGNGGWVYVDIDGPKKGEGILGKDVFPFIMQFNENFNINGLETNKVVEKVGVFPLGIGLKNSPTRENLKTGSGENIPQGLRNMGCSKENGGSYAGGLCGALIMTDGWEIKDDYPW